MLSASPAELALSTPKRYFSALLDVFNGLLEVSLLDLDHPSQLFALGHLPDLRLTNVMDGELVECDALGTALVPGLLVVLEGALGGLSPLSLGDLLTKSEYLLPLGEGHLLQILVQKIFKEFVEALPVLPSLRLPFRPGSR